jgi:protein SCO1/2
MLCTLQLNGLIDALKELSWSPPEQFRIVTVSFDPVETPSLAKAKKQNYVGEYGRPSAAAGWHFLTGTPNSVKALTEAVGFNYKWNDQRKEWMHAAAVYICTPEGRLSRYLYGVQYDPNTLRLSLVEASEGKTGSPLDQIILYCYRYDPAEGRYGPAALNIMRAGGGLTAIILTTTLATLWLRDVRRRRKPAEEAES